LQLRPTWLQLGPKRLQLKSNMLQLDAKQLQLGAFCIENTLTLSVAIVELDCVQLQPVRIQLQMGRSELQPVYIQLQTGQSEIQLVRVRLQLVHASCNQCSISVATAEEVHVYSSLLVVMFCSLNHSWIECNCHGRHWHGTRRWMDRRAARTKTCNSVPGSWMHG